MSPHRQSSRRRRTSIVAAVLALPMLVWASPSAAGADQAPTATGAEGGAEPGTLVGGKVVKQGWWARSNEPPPETGVLAPPSVPALAAPKGTLPVADVGGQSERIAALEFALDGKTGGTVDSVVLALRESADPTANPNSAAASVYACPITDSFWVGAENGPWATKPAYDCATGSVKGVRDETGVWRFDLTSLAFGWLSSDSGLPPAVVLVSGTAAQAAPDPAAAPAPSSFQVAFDAVQGLGLNAKTSAAATSGGKGGKGGKGNDGSDDDAGADDSGPASGSGDSGGSPSGGGILDLAGAAAGGELDAGAAADPGAAAPVDSAATAGEGETATPVLAPVSSVPWHDGLGRGALLLLPVALLLAYACMLALGPTGQPVVGQGRRGVSRALERLRTAGTAIGQGRARS